MCYRRPHGFTLIEVLVVLVILGLLAGVVTVNVRHYLVEGKRRAVTAQMASFRQALDTFYTALGRYPSSSEGLDALTAKSERIPDPLLRLIPPDPWGRLYQYNQPGRSEPYDIICFGADGREGGTGEDADITCWDLDTPANKESAR